MQVEKLRSVLYPSDTQAADPERIRTGYPALERKDMDSNVSHLHTPENKAKCHAGRIAQTAGKEPGAYSRERLRVAEERAAYWRKCVAGVEADQARKLERERKAAEAIIATAQQRAVVKHSLETRMSNIENALTAIMAHLTTPGGSK